MKRTLAVILILAVLLVSLCGCSPAKPALTGDITATTFILVARTYVVADFAGTAPAADFDCDAYLNREGQPLELVVLHFHRQSGNHYQAQQVLPAGKIARPAPALRYRFAGTISVVVAMEDAPVSNG